MPFGLGPHNCLDMMFALLEAKLALIGILQRFTFVQSPETEVCIATGLYTIRLLSIALELLVEIIQY